jgi:hypothetical protein
VCPATIKGIKSVTGEQICLWQNNTEALAGHLLFCPTEDSKLFFGGATNKAELLDDVTVKLPTLEATDFWDISLL